MHTLHKHTHPKTNSWSISYNSGVCKWQSQVYWKSCQHSEKLWKIKQWGELLKEALIKQKRGGQDRWRRRYALSSWVLLLVAIQEDGSCKPHTARLSAFNMRKKQSYISAVSSNTYSRFTCSYAMALTPSLHQTTSHAACDVHCSENYYPQRPN